MLSKICNTLDFVSIKDIHISSHHMTEPHRRLCSSESLLVQSADANSPDVNTQDATNLSAKNQYVHLHCQISQIENDGKGFMFI